MSPSLLQACLQLRLRCLRCGDYDLFLPAGDAAAHPPARCRWCRSSSMDCIAQSHGYTTRPLPTVTSPRRMDGGSHLYWAPVRGQGQRPTQRAGHRRGRKPKLTPAQCAEIVRRASAPHHEQRVALAKEFQVNPHTVYKVLRAARNRSSKPKAEAAHA